MRKAQEAKNNTIVIVDDYCSTPDNVTLINSFGTMKDDVNHFRVNIKEMNFQIGISQTDFTGNTTNQTKARAELAKFLAANICAPSARYARSINDSDLELIFKHSEAQLKHYAISGVIPLVTTIIDKANDLLTNVPAFTVYTGIIAQNITDANALKETLRGFFGQAKLMKRAVSRALHQIDVIQKDIWEHDFVNLIDDSQHFNTTNPDFSKGMVTATAIDDLPTEHTGINGFGHDKDGNVIIGGSITNIDMPSRPPMKFDNLGYYHDDTFQWGVYRFLFTHPDFQDQTKTVTIPRGKKIVQNVIMLPR